MNRLGWIRSIIGVPSSRSAVSNEEVLLQVREGFQSIAAAWQRFELEISDKLDRTRGELKAYAELVGERIRILEARIEILEDILFEPDPSIKEQKLSAARKLVVSKNPFDKSAA